ncbi:MAG: histone deacetylase [Dissulfurispiraceae bacterium]|jgi:acetoin utilization deacetylase AcuC-like enzyme|nr:histone deacetylase [Dissulfurispiraceae bacterium]
MKKIGYVFSDIFLKHKLPHWHPESADRLEAINKTLREADLLSKLTMISPRPAEEEELMLVHTKAHIEKIKTFGPGYIDQDTYISEGSHEAALHAAGAVIRAVEMCAEGSIHGAFCAVRPPGHHAESDRAMGFCLFNNIAIAARCGQTMGFKKIFITDFDVHHGNGTQHTFQDDDSVFYFSTHQNPFYPGTGQHNESGTGKGRGFTMNLPLEAGVGDDDFIRIYNQILPAAVKDFNPDLILVSAGYDLHMNDPLARMNVSDAGIKGIIKGILSAAWSSNNTPVVFTLEGGYNLHHLAQSVKITIESMLNFPD